MLDKYIINSNTLAIVPEGKNKSRVIEKYLSCVVNMLPTQIIELSCLHFGSSLKGRSESSTYYIGSKCKVPIMINDSQKDIYFSTCAYNNDNCVWINYHGINKFYIGIDNKNSTTIELINHKLVTLKVSNRIICNQFLKSSRLDSIYKSKNR